MCGQLGLSVCSDALIGCLTACLGIFCNMFLLSRVLNRRSPFSFPSDFQFLRINETVPGTTTSLVKVRHMYS